MLTRLIATISCLLCISFPVFCQSPNRTEEKITPLEYSQALKLSRRFAAELMDRKDIGPLMSRYFFPGFEKFLPKDSLFFLPDEVKRTHYLEAKLRRLYAAEVNFLYLMAFYQEMYAKESDVDNPDPLSFLPQDVRTVINRDKAFWEKMSEPDKQKRSQNQMTARESNAYFDKSLAFLTKIERRLRKHLIKVNSKSQETQKLLQKHPMQGYSTFEPWEYTCEKQCYVGFNFPKGTRLIMVEMPFLQQLVLVRKGHKLRVLAVLFGD